MSESPGRTADQVLTALVEQSRTIAELTSGLSPAALRRPPARGEWSLNDVLAHLRSCGDMWGKAIELILTQDHPTFRAINPRRWIESTDYPDLQFAPSFRAYRKQRDELVARLRGVPRSAWARSATVTGAGRPLERTAMEYATWLANHERSHLKQIAQLSKRARARTGMT